MYGAEIELDTLTDTDRAGTEDEHLLFLVRVAEGTGRLVLRAEYAVVVRGLGLELCGTGIDHLERGVDVPLVAHLADLVLAVAGEAGNDVVREFDALRFAKQGLVHRLAVESVLHVYDDLQLIDEPLVDLRDVVDLLVAVATAKCLGDHPDTTVIDTVKQLMKIMIVEVGEVVGHQRIDVLLEGTDGLHEAALEVVCNRHHLTGRLHLGAESVLCGDELIERKTRHLDNTVVEHRLEGCVGLTGNGILDLVEGVAQCDLCGYLRDRVTGRLRCEGGGSGYTRVYLDDAVLEALRIQGILYVTAAGDTELGDNVERGGTEHLVLLIRQGLGRSHDDGVTGMDADRVEVLHVTYGDDIARRIAHYLVLDFLPAGDASLDQNLVYAAETETVLEDLLALLTVLCDTTAGTAEGVGRTQYDRITDLLCDLETTLEIMYDL